MSDTLDKFRAYYPEFAGVDDAVVNVFLGDAAAELIPVKWGVYYQRGVCALAGHLLSMRARSALAGGVGDGSGLAVTGGATSIKTGDLSISVGGSGSVAGHRDSSLSDAILASTIYGQEFIRLRRNLYIGPVVL